MSNTYDMIATVDIDISSPVVGDTTFDNLLILGPAPAAGTDRCGAVAAYSSIEEVEEAGFTVAGEDADPVGLAASVAFSQSPAPDVIYIAVREPSGYGGESAEEQEEEEEELEVATAEETQAMLDEAYAEAASEEDSSEDTEEESSDEAESEEEEEETAELEDITETLARALKNTGWYVLCTAGVDSSLYEEIAEYMETRERLFCYTELDFFQNGETPSVGSSWYRTLGIYGRESSDQAEEDIPAENRYLNVAFAAKWLSYESGSETAAFKTLSGVYPAELSASEMEALQESCLSWYMEVGSRSVTMNGKVMAGEWADVLRFRDWLKNDMQTRVAGVFIRNPKIPYTDAGIALIQNQMLASLKAGQDAGGIAEDEYDSDGELLEGYTTSVPLAADLTAEQRASRTLTGCTFTARLTGAIHFAELSGSLTYEL